MIRVCHVITGLNTGGAEMMLAKLAGAMDKRAFPTSVVSLLGPGPLTPLVQEAGVPVRHLDLSRGAADPAALFKLVRILREARPDIVQTWLYHADLLGLTAAALARTGRVIWNLRCSDMDFSNSGRLTRLTVGACAKLSRLPAAVIANSSIAVDVHRELGYAPRRFEVIPNGFDLERYVPDPDARSAVRAEVGAPQEAPLVGMVARYDPQKDHATFLQAAREIAAGRPDAHFVLCGDGVDASNADITRRAREAGIQPNLHLLGRREDAWRLMAALDVGVLSSAYGEGFPNVVGETMACGVPCVVTDTGDSAVVTGDTGRAVPPRNPAALAAAVLDILNLSEADRLALGRAARKRVEDNYSLSAIAARYAALYRDIAG